MRKTVIVGIALLCVCALFARSGPSAQRTILGDGGTTGSGPVSVAVANFPQVQPVAVDKTVTVTGSVAVTNLPAVQNVAGSINVANLPLDADGNVRVGGTLTLAAPPIPTARFAGYTAATFSEGTGLLTLNRACHAEFLGTRVCGGIELVNMIPPPPVVVPNQGGGPELPG
jgi:hypothetical protein